MMKKSIFTALLALILAGAMSSCSGNSPEGVVDRFFKCVSNKDYDGLAHLLYLDDELDGREPTDEEWEKFAAELKKYGSFGLGKLGDIKSFEILDVDVLDNPKPGYVAFIEVKTIDSNEDKEWKIVKLKMAKNGEWKVNGFDRSQR